MKFIPFKFFLLLLLLFPLSAWLYTMPLRASHPTLPDLPNSDNTVHALLAGASAISAGGAHSCVLTSEGGVLCWGGNGTGQLGDGSKTDRTTPVAVSGLSSGVTAISAGDVHTCALTTSGGVRCWGGNAAGQLGDGSTDDRSSPVVVNGLSSGVIAIRAGGTHTCALTTAGGVRCWGGNDYGQLGDGSTDPSSTPVAVSDLSSGVTAISVGGSHSCALTAAGGVRCWGYNWDGQLGDGSTMQRTAPVAVSGLSSGVTAISAGGSHTCALTTAGGVRCWGGNAAGQLGDGSTNPRTTPVAVSGLSSGVIAVSAGDVHSCALTSAGGVRCWGDNYYGQLGDGSIDDKSTPVAANGLSSGIASINTGKYHTCVLNTIGGALCWGTNSNGQLGNGFSGYYSSTPVTISGLSSGVSAVRAGYAHTCALTSAGGVRCWGYNNDSQLGDGSMTKRTSPVAVSGLSNGIKAISAGNAHSCALTTAGGLLCWGWNYYGQLGDGSTTQRTTPVAVNGLSSGVTAISTGEYHSCALTTAGGVLCWGSNDYGQLGDDSKTKRITPVAVSGLSSGVSAISAGYAHTCALTTAGGVLCWGWNSSSQLGDGSTEDRTVPVAVSGLSSGVTAISAGGTHTCALTTAGDIRCWGYNGAGQLGDGSITDRATPVAVSGLSSDIAAISAGRIHSCALTTAGSVRCWGFNAAGQLGDGSTTDRTKPVAVKGLSSGVTAISAGRFHTCALTTDGGGLCWGSNSDSQLGTGDGWSTAAVAVVGLAGNPPTPTATATAPAINTATPTATPTSTPNPPSKIFLPSVTR